MIESKNIAIAHEGGGTKIIRKLFIPLHLENNKRLSLFKHFSVTHYINDVVL
jgi:hypothetical protein